MDDDQHAADKLVAADPGLAKLSASRWKPGQSGNPSGPKPNRNLSASEYMRRVQYKLARRMVKLAFDENTPPQVRATLMIECLNRGLGRPAQAIVNANVTGDQAQEIVFRWLDGLNTAPPAQPEPRLIEHEPVQADVPDTSKNEGNG